MGEGVTIEHSTGPIAIISEVSIDRFTVVGRLIEIIASADPSPIDLSRDPAEIEVKLSFNNLSTHRLIVDEYISNSILVDKSITELNRMINGGSTKLKRQMKLFYMESLSHFTIFNFPGDLEKLRLHSDHIVADVMSRVKKLVLGSSDLRNGYFLEDINFGVMLITCYSIIECIVLENPNDYN